nr:uncharacterized protein LOC129267083 [Lytechinus pictus]
MRLKAHFAKDKEEESQPVSNVMTPPTFESLQPKRSSWTPPEGQNANLELFIDKCRSDLGALNMDSRHTCSNMTESEQDAFKSLRNNSSYVIKPADKGGAVVVWRRELYISESQRQLNNTEFYQGVGKDLTDEHQKKVKDTIDDLVENEALPPSARNLCQWNPHSPVFYLLPKIHKEGNPGRPIVSTIGCPTELISKYLDGIFTPIVSMLKTYVKDSSEALRILESVTLPADGDRYLFTMDVASLYTNIPMEEALRAIQHFLRKFPSDDRPDDSTILRLTELVLKLSSFQFEDEFYVQKKGVDMGTKIGPSYACLFVGFVEEELLNNYHGPKPPLLKRYIDDFVGVAICSMEDLTSFIEYFNNYHPSIRFTHDISDQTVPFLDINFRIKGTGIT